MAVPPIFDLISGLLIFALLIAIYMLPTICAYYGKGKFKEVVLVINIFLGWTFIGWVIALAIAMVSSD